jgi:hypothetical protein
MILNGRSTPLQFAILPVARQGRGCRFNSDHFRRGIKDLQVNQVTCSWQIESIGGNFSGDVLLTRKLFAPLIRPLDLESVFVSGPSLPGRASSAL